MTFKEKQIKDGRMDINWLYIKQAYCLHFWFVNDFFCMSLLFCIKLKGGKRL